MVQHRRARLVATVVLGVGGVVGAALTLPSVGSSAAPAGTTVARTHDKAARTNVVKVR